MSNYIRLGEVSAASLGNPPTGKHFEFFDLDNLDANGKGTFTLRDDAGNDTTYSGQSQNLSQLGWIWVRDDTYDAAAPLSLSSGVRTLYDFTIDFDLDADAPSGISTADWFDEPTSKITPDTDGQSYLFRIKMTANPTLNNRNFTIDIDVNGSIIWEKTIRLARGAGTDSVITETAWIFIGSSFETNGATIRLTCDGDCDVFDFNLGLSRININK